MKNCILPTERSDLLNVPPLDLAVVGRVPRDEDVVHVEVGEGQGGRVEAAEVKRGYDVPISRYFDHISYLKN